MLLRKLKKKDAPLMYERMTAKDVNKYFRFNPEHITLSSCKKFIENSFTNNDQTFAIIDDHDEYVGSISLKHIDDNDLNAEFAIAIREKYRGKGYGTKAIEELLSYAFKTLKLHKIYLNVLSDNEAAIKLYEKAGFIYEGELKKHIKINNQFKDLKLYGIWSENYEEKSKND